MKRIIPLIMLGIFAILCLIISGCGEDDATSSGLKPGNENDPQFQFFSGIINGDNISANLAFLDLSLMLFDSIPGGIGGPFKLSDIDQDIEVIHITNYTYSDYWHIFTLEVEAYDEQDEDIDSVFLSGIDSIRFEGITGPMQFPDSILTNVVKLRYHFDVEAFGAQGEMAASSDASIDLAGIFGGDFTINGSTHEAIEAEGEDSANYMYIEMATNQTFTNILIDSLVQYEESCPGYGEIGVAAALSLMLIHEETDTLSTSGAWTIDFDYHPDRTVTVTYVDGNSQWVVTEDCSGSEPGKLNWIPATKIMRR